MKEKFKIQTIREKITLSIFVGIILCALLAAFIVSLVVNDQMEENYEIDKEAAIESLSHSLTPLLDLYDYKQVERIISSSLAYESIADVAVFNKGGILIVSASEQDVSSQDLEVVRHNLTSNGTVVGSFEVGFSKKYIDEQIRTTTGALTSGLMGFLLLMGFALFIFMNRYVIRPLATFTNTIKNMDSENLSLRVQIHSDDEIGKLAASFNLMADDIEVSHRALKKAYDELELLNKELEQKVKQRTRALEVATEEAKTANKSKSDFLAGMSHELRTPLNAVIGFSQVLEKKYFGDLNEKQEKYVANILGSGQHLLSLINDILDLSKIEAGKMELEPSTVKIKNLLESIMIVIKERAMKHRIELDVHTSKDLEDLEITADERRLKQIMYNLLSNAVKFTPDGGTITVEGKRDGKELIVSVSDTGIGLTPQQQKKVFEEFYQVSTGVKDKTPGTGLGLPLTRRIVEMHGGRLWVESKGKDRGSKFVFTLPIGGAGRAVKGTERKVN